MEVDTTTSPNKLRGCSVKLEKLDDSFVEEYHKSEADYSEADGCSEEEANHEADESRTEEESEDPPRKKIRIASFAVEPSENPIKSEPGSVSSSEGPEVKMFSDSLEMSCLVCCKACNKIITWDGFNRHVEKAHRNRKEVEYEFTRKTYHKCKICNCVMLLNLRKLQSHVSKHQLSLQEYKDRHLNTKPAAAAAVVKPSHPLDPVNIPPRRRMAAVLSNRLDEICRIRCNVCEADVQYDELLRHLRSAHGLATKDGYGEYRFTVYRLHECSLCSRQVIFTRKNVGAHALKVHQMVFPEYARQYLEDVPQGPDGSPKMVPAEDNSTNGAAVSPSKPAVTVNGRKEEKNAVKSSLVEAAGPQVAACNICQERVPLSSSSIAAHLLKVHGIGGRAAIKPPDLIPGKAKAADSAPKTYSDNVADMCRVRCKFCGRDVSAGSITKHARLYHGIHSIQDYGEVEYVNPTYHKCKLCNLELIFTARTIQKHVTRRHHISPEAYRKNYLTNSSQQIPLGSPLPKPAFMEPLVNKISEKTVEYTDDLRNVCFVRCRLCGQEESLDRIRQHCRAQHKDSNTAISHPFTRRTFHMCKLCGVEFQLSIGALCRHLLEAHKLALSAYIINFLVKKPSTNETDLNLPILEKAGNEVVISDPQDVAVESSPPRLVKQGDEEEEEDVSEQEEVEEINDDDLVEVLEQEENDPLVYVEASCQDDEENSSQGSPDPRQKSRSPRGPPPLKRVHQDEEVEVEEEGGEDDGEELRLQGEAVTAVLEEEMELSDEDEAALAGGVVEVEMESSSSSPVVRSQRIYCDDTSKFCQVRCKICQKLMAYDGILAHLQRVHRVRSKEEYGAQEWVWRAYHNCRLCGSSLLWTNSLISSHTNKKHGLRWAEYRDQYLAHPSNPSTLWPGPQPALAAASSPGPKKVSGEGSSGGDGVLDPHKIYSDNVHQMSIVQCNFCELVFTPSSVWGHARVVHAIGPHWKDYGQFNYLRQTYHKCKICGIERPFHRKAVGKHVSNAHGLSWQAYRRGYLIQEPEDEQDTSNSVQIHEEEQEEEEGGGEAPVEATKEQRDLMQGFGSLWGDPLLITHDQTANGDLQEEDEDQHRPTNGASQEEEEEGDSEGDGVVAVGYEDSAAEDEAVAAYPDVVLYDGDSSDRRDEEECEEDDNEDDEVLDEVQTVGARVPQQRKKRFSDDLAETCLLRCRLCGQETIPKSFHKHLEMRHQMSKAQYGPLTYVRKTFHRCHLCGAVMNFTRDSIGGHCRKRHQIDVQEYCSKYLKNSASPSTVPAAAFVPIPMDKRSVVVKRPNPSASRPPAPLLQEPTLAEPDMLGRIFSDDLEQMALVVCRICQTTMAPRKLLRHIRTDHGIESKEEYGELDYYRKTYHKCKLCSSVFLWTLDRVRDHTTRMHRLGLVEYCDTYLGSSAGLDAA